ncbi:MAG: chromosome segregation protein SMC [Myxococcota bacterium]|nr:chromosome segregation protein SMC [Myxococcota bacterium]
MYLLELAAQNVRGLSPTVRAALKPGYLLIQTPAAAPAPLAGLVVALCYPDGRGEDAAFAVPGQKAKVALTLLGNDQTTYRLMRALGGQGNLSRLNKAAGAYEVITEDSGEMAQFLRGQAGFPSRGSFERLFTFTTAQLPSRRPKPAARPAPGASGPALSSAGLPSAQAVLPASDVRAAQEKLRGLEEELQLAKEVEDLQFKLDGMASQLFELESRLKGADGLKAALAQARQEHGGAPSAEKFGLPADILERASQYPQLEARRDEQLARLEAEAPASDAEPQEAAFVPPLTGDQRFWGALGAGVLFLGLGIFLEGTARYVALLDIPAFSFAALLALRYVDDKADSQKTTRRGGMRASREKKIRDDFDSEARVVRQALGAMDVSSPAELIEVLGRKPLLLMKVEDYRAQLAAYEQDPEYLGAMAAQNKLQREQETLNAQLLVKGSYVRDAREVERELNRTRESIQLALAGATAAPAAPALGAAPAAGEPLEDPCGPLLSAAADLLQSDLPTLAAGAKDRIAQYLAALSDRRVMGVEFDLTGRATALLAGGARSAAGALPPRDLDLLYLSLRLTLIEKVSARQKVPVLIEDGLAVEESKYPLLARMIKHLGTLTQVIHLSSHPAFAQAADAQLPG